MPKEDVERVLGKALLDPGFEQSLLALDDRAGTLAKVRKDFPDLDEQDIKVLMSIPAVPDLGEFARKYLRKIGEE